MPDRLWRAVNTGDKLHVDPDCSAIRQANHVEETRPECFPDPDICALCGGDAGSNGGGSRELYEQAKQIGEQRAEGSDD